MKLIRGVGFNSGGKYKARECGKDTEVYRYWYNMMQRCYNPKYHDTQPTYVGCSVTTEWHNFQNFAEWVCNDKYRNNGYHLDKDILVPNNKVYSPNTCCFVPSELNTLCNSYLNARGEHPQGVYWNKKAEKYLSRIRIHGKHKHLGYFHCPKEAHQAYVIAKEAHVKVMANLWRDRIAPEVYEALMAWRVQ